MLKPPNVVNVYKLQPKPTEIKLPSTWTNMVVVWMVQSDMPDDLLYDKKWMKEVRSSLADLEK
jgi:hypothetical protein